MVSRGNLPYQFSKGTKMVAQEMIDGTLYTTVTCPLSPGSSAQRVGPGCAPGQEALVCTQAHLAASWSSSACSSHLRTTLAIYLTPVAWGPPEQRPQVLLLTVGDKYNAMALQVSERVLISVSVTFPFGLHGTFIPTLRGRFIDWPLSQSQVPFVCK